MSYSILIRNKYFAGIDKIDNFKTFYDAISYCKTDIKVRHEVVKKTEQFEENIYYIYTTNFRYEIYQFEI